MNNLQLDYFLSVANTRNLTRSAQELFVSPPAISKQISRLEKELGVHLFTRLGRGMELTTAGTHMHEFFSSQKAALELAIKNARDAEHIQSKKLTFGIIKSWSVYEPLRRFREFLLKPPYEAELSVRECDIDVIVSLLEAGEADVIICLGGEFSAIDRTEEVVTIPLIKTRRIFLFSARNPLAKKKDLVPSDFANMPLLSPTGPKHIAALNDIRSLCSSLGFLPRIVHMQYFSTLFGVGIDAGFTLIDELSEKLYNPAFASLELDETHTVNLAWLKSNKNPAIEALPYCVDMFNSWQSNRG